jgi:hypothetical protein
MVNDYGADLPVGKTWTHPLSPDDALKIGTIDLRIVPDYTRMGGIINPNGLGPV